ncbi:hypothetical protein ACJQWK_00401 [Exserohilum turcicum]
MAPSRALLRRGLATATPCWRPASCLPTAFATPIQKPQHIPALRPGPWRQPLSCTPRTQAYSQSASTTPQAPDYLNEAELHVFNKIKSELEPLKLEVCTDFPTLSSRDVAQMRRCERLALMTPLAPPITAL